MEGNVSNLVSCKLLTRQRLQKAIEADLGPEWTLKDFEIKNFSRKEDHYAVTEVSCSATKEGKERIAHYVAKLNPCIGIFKEEITEEFFEREGKFLMEVAPTLNAILSPICDQNLTFPVCVYANLEAGSEILILKDLRFEGYKMVDKDEGFDFEHAKLAIKEIAKLHASSVVFKNNLENKNVSEYFPFLGNKWLDFSSKSFKLFETLLQGGVATSLAIMKQHKEYKEQAIWLKDHQTKLIDIYAELIKSSPGNMNVINHGDCWRNNMVFRYDDNGHPQEVTLLDFQICKVGSIGLDLNYFFYTSLTGDERNKSYEQLLAEYYENFEQIMKFNNQDMPFTKSELREEIMSKTLFGILTRILTLPFVVSVGESGLDLTYEEEESKEEQTGELIDSWIKLPELAKIYKTQLIAVIEDMKTKGILMEDYSYIPSIRKDNNPHKLLTRRLLEETVKNDLGPQWELKDFTIKDFTKKGDNFACSVTGVACTAIRMGKKETLHYVAKLNPLRDTTENDDFSEEIFEREGKFLTDVAPTLNSILFDINYTPINVPDCVYVNFEFGNEVLILRDLRLKAYKMLERQAGMDFEHAMILMRELAKLHASSVVFKNKLQPKTVLDIYPFLTDNFLNPGESGREMVRMILENGIAVSMTMIKPLKQYEKQYAWLEKVKPKVLDFYMELLKFCPENMKVICHGDCWTNNFLFRYDAAGQPSEVTLLDFQSCRFGSIGLDLNYALYHCFTGEFRKEFQNQILSEYFKVFQEIIEAASMVMPFTQDEFHKEVLEKTAFGIICSLVALPLMICESDDAPNFMDVKEEDKEQFRKDLADMILKLAETSEVFKTRFVSVVEDICGKGVIDMKFTSL